jgi:serine/threonine protein kinase
MSDELPELPGYVVQLSDYNFERQLSASHYTNVYLARHSTSKAPCVIKQVIQKQLDARHRQSFRREISVSMKCTGKSPFLVRFIGYTRVSPYSLLFDNVLNGSLFEAIHHRYRKFTGTQKTAIAFGVAQGMRSLHQMSIIHGDLTSSAILLDENMIPKVSPARSSRPSGDDSAWIGNVCPNYAAPEVLQGQPGTSESDVFSFGVVVWELATERFPFAGKIAAQIQAAWGGRIRLAIPEDMPGWASLLPLCWAVDPTRRPPFTEIVEKLKRGELNFPGCDESAIRAFFDSSERLPQPEAPVGPADYVEKIRLPSAGARLGLVDEASKDRDSAVAFMNAAVLVAMRDKDLVTNRNAILALIQLLTRHRKFVDMFVGEKLYEQLTFEKKELVDYTLSVFLPLLEAHPDIVGHALVTRIAAFIETYPKKVLRLFSLLCQSYTEENFEWMVVDVLLLHIDLFMKREMTRDIAQVLYFLVARYKVFRMERSRSCIRFFTTCLESDNDEVLEMSYLIVTSLRLREIVPPALLQRHLANPALRQAVVRYLTVARLDDLDPSVIDLLFETSEKKLAIILLWRFAGIPKFVPTIIASDDHLLEFDPTDVLRLIMLLMASRNVRPAVSALQSLPGVLTALARTGDALFLGLIRRVVRRLVFTQELIERLESAGFIAAYIARAVSHDDEGVFKSCCLVVDAILHAGFARSVLGFLPALADHIATSVRFQTYALSLLALFGYYREAHDSIRKLGVPQIVREMEVLPQNQPVFQNFKKNLQFL